MQLETLKATEKPNPHRRSGPKMKLYCRKEVGIARDMHHSPVVRAVQWQITC
jgi:hypothetical protein